MTTTECFVTIESTAEGRAGYFFDYSQSAEKQQMAGVPLGLLDWKFFFFSWWRNPLYWLDSTDVVIPDRPAFEARLRDKNIVES